MSYPDICIGSDGLRRCGWVGEDEQYRRYHDTEWGFPLYGDQPLFEKMSLEGFQAGLSWITILRKRENFRNAFAGFNIHTVANFTENDILRLLGDRGIVRNRAKIVAVINNAQITRTLISADPGALDRLIWSYAPPQRPQRRSSLAEIPATTAESTALSRALKKLGYRFVGPTTMYALMQAAGLIDDHLSDCWRAERGRTDSHAVTARAG